ncbi:hypothetical protein HanPSC8_Chr15g0666051 [Helianthus annuus]|nr:hypothetical protein HanPSC8_Chr15g0666051 [Helianthus annuus]
MERNAYMLQGNDGLEELHTSRIRKMGDYNRDKGLFSHHGGYGGGYYSQQHGAYPSQGYSYPPAAYPPAAYPQGGYSSYGGYPPQGYPPNAG